MSHVGIMNVSDFPLQECCYSGQFTELRPPNMQALKYVRDDLQKKRRKIKKFFENQEYELAQNEIFQSFKKRLAYIINRNNIVKIVPCGHFATYFVYWYKLTTQHMTTITILDDIPHPSGTAGGWKKLRKETIESLQALS